MRLSVRKLEVGPMENLASARVLPGTASCGSFFIGLLMK